MNPFYERRAKVFFLKYKKVLVFSAVLLGFGIWFTVYAMNWERRDKLLEVYFFDVTKGSSVFVRTPNGITALIGAGQGSDIIRKLTSATPFYRKAIDFLIYGRDESNNVGFVDVANRYKIGNVIHVASTTIDADLHLEIDRYDGVPITIEMIGTGLLLPTEEPPIQISFGTHKFLIADLLSRKSQQLLYASSSVSNISVLQMRSVAQTRVSSNFFSKAMPEYLVSSKFPARPKTPVITATSTTKTMTKKKSTRKPSPPKDPPFDFFSLSAVHKFTLDRDGTVSFYSDGITLQTKTAKGRSNH